LAKNRVERGFAEIQKRKRQNAWNYLGKSCDQKAIEQGLTRRGVGMKKAITQTTKKKGQKKEFQSSPWESIVGGEKVREELRRFIAGGDGKQKLGRLRACPKQECVRWEEAATVPKLLFRGEEGGLRWKGKYFLLF